MKISIIIPTRNRSGLLKKALTSICKQSLNMGDFEVIVVDNGSSDNTKEVYSSFKNKIPNLIYFFENRPGLHAGRHKGLELSSAEILTYIDDDSELFPEHLYNLLLTFKNKNIVLVGGKNLPSFEEIPPGWLIDLWNTDKIISYLSIIDKGEKIHEIDPLFVWGCNFSIRKSILLEAGGFNPDAMPKELIKYRGDGETSVSNFIKLKNYTTIYNPKVSIHHFVSKERMTEKYLYIRYYNQGISSSYSTIRKYHKYSDLENRKNKYLLNEDKGLSIHDKHKIIINNAFLDGYIFHQKECKKDLDLLNWVKKENYLNDQSKVYYNEHT